MGSFLVVVGWRVDHHPVGLGRWLGNIDQPLGKAHSIRERTSAVPSISLQLLLLPRRTEEEKEEKGGSSSSSLDLGDRPGDAVGFCWQRAPF